MDPSISICFPKVRQTGTISVERCPIKGRNAWSSKQVLGQLVVY